jgi:thiamine-phosphate pyrophosphorylase
MTFDPLSLRLIAITDDLRDGMEGLVRRSVAAAEGGATMVQLRLKNAEARLMVEVARRLIAALPVPLVVNDRLDVALAVGAAGVHLGPDDIPPVAARAIVPAGFVIGASIGSDAEAPLAEGADYVGIGPVYATSSKDDAGAAIGVREFERLRILTRKPAVAIGGIAPDNAHDVMKSGAAGVAVIRSVLAAPDPLVAARELRSAIGK